MVTLRPNRPAQIRFFGMSRAASSARSSSHSSRMRGCLERVERARSRDVQGGAAGPRSGRKRSGPRSRPVAAAATTPQDSHMAQSRRSH
jgi:hypothetical protein